MITTRFTRLLTAATLLTFCLTGISQTSRAAESRAADITDIKVSFKLDPRLTKSMYMGDRWVSPPTYTSTVREGEELTVEARVEVVGAKGKQINIKPKWTPTDPEMVTVTPGQGNEFKITVRRSGQSNLKVSVPGFSRNLAIKATNQGSAMQVEISQKP